MWSIGTIFVELILRVPFLAGETDMDQLKKTFHAMGSPSEQEWPVRNRQMKRTER
jgi:cyclin-dependent kinase 7